MGSRLANPFSFSHVDVGEAFQFINHIMAERRRNTTGRSGRALAFKPTGRGFETNSGGTRTPSVNHQGERKAFQAYCISPYIKLIRVVKVGFDKAYYSQHRSMCWLS